jgi:hypothetical protein
MCVFSDLEVNDLRRRYHGYRPSLKTSNRWIRDPEVLPRGSYPFNGTTFVHMYEGA